MLDIKDYVLLAAGATISGIITFGFYIASTFEKKNQKYLEFGIASRLFLGPNRTTIKPVYEFASNIGAKYLGKAALFIRNSGNTTIRSEDFSPNDPLKLTKISGYFEVCRIWSDCNTVETHITRKNGHIFIDINNLQPKKTVCFIFFENGSTVPTLIGKPLDGRRSTLGSFSSSLLGAVISNALLLLILLMGSIASSNENLWPYSATALFLCLTALFVITSTILFYLFIHRPAIKDKFILNILYEEGLSAHFSTSYMANLYRKNDDHQHEPPGLDLPINFESEDEKVDTSTQK